MDHVDNACEQATDGIDTIKICAFHNGHKREGWIDFWQGVEAAPEFVRPDWEISNEDSMLMYFTSGTEGMPKMVVHDFKYPLCHIVTRTLLAQPRRAVRTSHDDRYRMGDGYLGITISTDTLRSHYCHL